MRIILILKMANKIIPYRKDLKPLARLLRKNQTEAEKLLWSVLRKKSLGVEFHRQVPILDYIVDFYCHEIGLAIEVDGSIHETQFLEDSKRAEKIESYGVVFVRFTNEEVLSNLRIVANTIRNEIEQLR